MLKIRLQRVGRKHDPSFRLVLTDSKNSTKSGRFLEVLGSYNARFGTPVFQKDRILHWISKGVQPTPTVHNLLINAQILEGKKKNVLPKKTVPKKEEKEAVSLEATEEKAQEEVATPKEEERVKEVA